METKAKWIPDTSIIQIIKSPYWTLLLQVGLNKKSATHSHSPDPCAKTQLLSFSSEEWKNWEGSPLPKITHLATIAGFANLSFQYNI